MQQSKEHITNFFLVYFLANFLAVMWYSVTLTQNAVAAKQTTQREPSACNRNQIDYAVVSTSPGSHSERLLWIAAGSCWDLVSINVARVIVGKSELCAVLCWGEVQWGNLMGKTSQVMHRNNWNEDPCSPQDLASSTASSLITTPSTPVLAILTTIEPDT